jgi:hypothetical protein
MPEDQNQAGGGAVPDSELQAINTVVAALRPLRDDERKRVLEYVLGRFGAVPLKSQFASSALPAQSTAGSTATISGSHAVQDIRSLKEAKAPKSANEMAALVAYYVSELAGGTERKAQIDKNDIERYFKGAGFKLTSKAGQTLVNAKHAGYLDPGTEAGQYKLNPVGYNLVVHRLGSDGGVRKKRRRKQAAKKSRRKRS